VPAAGSPQNRRASKRTPPPPTSDDPCTAYAQAVVAGEIVAGPHVRNACRRHLDDLAKAGKRGFRWDVEAANKALGFFRDVLRLNGGQFEGLPFALHPSQQFIVGSLFGWRRADGTRRYRRAYIEIAKGNGKSPLMAGIGMWCLLADGEDRAEVYAAASKKDQAMVLFRDAVAMYQQSPALFARLTPSGGNPVWNLADLKTGSFFRPISSDDGQSGPRPSCALCDEIHEHRTGTLIEMLERGFKWRRQPLLIMATNSGTDRLSVCRQEHENAVKVAAGTRAPDAAFTYVGEVISDETFAFVCSLDPGDDPLEDPTCWVKSNPLLGVTVREENLASAVAQAKAIPGKLNNILRLNFCVWTESDTAWMARPTLEACLADFEPESEHSGAEVFVGVDLSATRDITAVAFVVPTGFVDRTREDGAIARLPTFDAWVEAWTPRDTLHERSLRDNMPYDIWADEGWLNAIRGEVVRFDFVAARLAEIASIFDVQAVAYDRYGFKRMFEPELDALGLTLPIVEHPQGGKKKGAESGLWMPGSKATLEAAMLDRRIRLRRSPVLVSAMMSAVTEEDPFGNAWFSKRRAVNRIDALVALAMALGAASAQAAQVDTLAMIV
jgi:phage terminase large subunit-like protein